MNFFKALSTEGTKFYLNIGKIEWIKEDLTNGRWTASTGNFIYEIDPSTIYTEENFRNYKLAFEQEQYRKGNLYNK